MRRIAILVVLIALDMWLIASSVRNGDGTSPFGIAPTVSAQQVCCPNGTGVYPHLGCNYNGSCELLYECGFDDCSACQGCDPLQEEQCISEGWTWNPETCACNPPPCNPAERNECVQAGCYWDDVTCSCTCPPPICDPRERQACLAEECTWDEITCTCTCPPPPSCDPIARQQCISEGCTWDDVNCTCTCPQVCSPGPPVLVGWDTYTTYFCLDCGLAEAFTTTTYFYVEYCQDGTVYDSWSETVLSGGQFVWDPDCQLNCQLE